MITMRMQARDLLDSMHSHFNSTENKLEQFLVILFITLILWVFLYVGIKIHYFYEEKKKKEISKKNFEKYR